MRITADGQQDVTVLEGSFDTSIQPDDLPCNNARNYWWYSLIFSASIIIILSFLERRNSPGRCGSRPAIVFPVNLLDYKTDHIGFAAAFGSMASHCWNLFWESNSAYSLAPTWSKTLVVMVEVLYIGIQYYPLFVCIQTPWVLTGSFLGLFFSGYWFWLYLAAVIKCPTSGDDSTSLTGKNIAVMVPVLVCLLVLMVKFVVKLTARVIRLIRTRSMPWRFAQDELESERLVQPCNVEYVKQLLTPVCCSPVTDYGQVRTPTRLYKIWVLLSRWLYLNDPTFKYSPRLVAIFSVGLICSYQFGIIIVLLMYQIEKAIPTMIIQPTNSTNTTDPNENMLGDLRLALEVFNISAMVSFILSSCLTVFSIFRILTNYRQNLKRMFKGDFKHLPFKRDSRYAQLILSDSLSYAGSQIAHIIWGYIISFAVLVGVSFLLAYTIILPLVDIIPRENLKYISNFLIGFVILQVIIVLQQLFCRVLLLRRPTVNDDGTESTTAVLAVDNRKIYHNMTYFLFFFYVVLGIFGCLVTIIKGMVLGVFFIARMDRCALRQEFETFDKGYMYYISFLHVEECHRHPVLLVFCDMLTQNLTTRRVKLHDYVTGTAPHLSQVDRARLISMDCSIRARNRWLKAYTMIRNPSLKLKDPDEEFDKLTELERSQQRLSRVLT